MRHQDYFNLIQPNRISTAEILQPEVYEDFKRRFRFKSREVIIESIRSIAMRQMIDSDEVFDETIRAIQNPCLPNMDFLMCAMMPHSQLRPLFTLMTGYNEWKVELYPVECMLTFVPIDLIGVWLSLRCGGNRWRKSDNGTEFYVPNSLDYEWLVTDEIESINRHVIMSDPNITFNLSLSEYIDRIFLGVGGLWSDVRLNKSGQLKGGKLNYQFNFRQNGAMQESRNLPPLEAVAMNYLTALTHGTIMPFNYRKILGDLIYGRTGTGSG